MEHSRNVEQVERTVTEDVVTHTLTLTDTEAGVLQDVLSVYWDQNSVRGEIYRVLRDRNKVDDVIRVGDTIERIAEWQGFADGPSVGDRGKVTEVHRSSHGDTVSADFDGKVLTSMIKNVRKVK